MYQIKKVSELSGVSVRTLHHYDDIGLLRPMKHENGYRIYSEEDMSRLQAILFYKYLGFSLHEIKELMRSEAADLLPLLKKQLSLMKREKERLGVLIDTLEKTIESTEKEKKMKTKDKFKGFVYEDNKAYTDEAKEKYGEDVVEESLQRQKGKEELLTEGFNRMFFAFAENMNRGLEASDEENVNLAKELHEHLCAYSFNCPKEVFSSIGYGYVQDERFRVNIDQFGEGTAQYVCDAIQEYVENNHDES